MSVPDLRFIVSLYVNKRRERVGRMVTLAPSLYVYLKQRPLSPPPSLPPKPFTGNRFAIFLCFHWAPLSFQKAWPLLGCLKCFKYLSKGWIHQPAKVVSQWTFRLSEKKLSLRSCKLIDWLKTLFKIPSA